MTAADSICRRSKYQYMHDASVCYNTSAGLSPISKRRYQKEQPFDICGQACSLFVSAIVKNEFRAGYFIARSHAANRFFHTQI